MFDQTLRTQRFFQGHDEAITAMAVHPDKVVVASSQGGKTSGTVCIWNSGARPAEWSPKSRAGAEAEAVEDVQKRVEEVKRIHIPKNTAGMSTMDFNEKGELLAMVTGVGNGSSGGAVLQVWDWKDGIMLAFAKAHANPVTMCRFNPFQSHDADEVLEDSRCYTLVTGGLRHVKLWVLQKVEHPLDVEDRNKDRGKKVDKPFGGASRGTYAAETKSEKKEKSLRSGKKSK
jgi:WD40 repeat protein